ncbi:MAG: hypothetical protein RLZZ618_599 [Pseudomonadota bacterium]|jgi:peptidyl-prolyl cis-trans isomerase D
MFEFIRTHARMFMGILVPLIVVSFVFINQGYDNLSEGANSPVAKVGGREINQAEWDASHRRSIDRFREQVPNLDVSMFDTPEMKQRALDDLVRERVVQFAAREAGFRATDQRVLNAYRSDPQFAQVRKADGSIDRPKLEQILNSQGMSVAGFEQIMREQIALKQVFAGVNGTAIAPATSASAAFDALFQQREVQIERFEPKAFAAQVKPTEAEIDAFYKDPKNAGQFKSTERVDVEYLVLDFASVKKGVSFPEEALRSYYTQNIKRFSKADERRARHIQILATAKSTPAERAAAKAKADALRADLAKTPASFADVAKKNSQDSASAARGGEIDAFIARGDSDPAYEAALFALKPKELSPVVETPEGFFIIELLEARGGATPFETARADIENELAATEVQKRFADAATEFTNLVYEQSDSLKPAADKLKLEIQTAKGVTRQPDPKGTGPLASPKFLEALFGRDALENKRNTQAIEAGPNLLVAGRVKVHTPAALLPLAEVRTRVVEQLVASQSAELARKQGEARLAVLRAAPATVLPSAPLLVSRAQSNDLAPDVLNAVLKAPATALPAFAGVNVGGDGFVVIKVNKVLGRDPVRADAVQVNTQYAQSWSTAESHALYASMKDRAGVKLLGKGAPLTDKSAPVLPVNATN